MGGGGDGSGEKGVRSEEMGVGRFTLFPLAHSHLGIPISIHIRNFFTYLCFMYTYKHIYIHIYEYIYEHMKICIYCIHENMKIYIYICLYIQYIYIHIFLFIYIHIIQLL